MPQVDESCAVRVVEGTRVELPQDSIRGFVQPEVDCKEQQMIAVSSSR